MINLPKKMLYAIEAVLDIAYHAGDPPVQSRDITRRQGIPRRYLEQSLQSLVREKILIGVRGPNGGYRLARERRRVTLGDIIRVVQGEAGKRDERGASELGKRVVQPVWDELRQGFMERLDSVSVDDLCARANDCNIPSEGRESLDFSI